MRARSLARFVSAALVAMGLPLTMSVQSATAAPCADIEVVFARGTVEPLPPLGLTGTAFVETLRASAGGRSVGSYGVEYQASGDFSNPTAFARTVLDGISDAQRHVEFIATTCPGTRIVIGGYSQGAVVAGFATMDGVPPGVAPEYDQYIPPPLPPEIASHVAAVVLFAKPSDRFMTDIGAPPIHVSPLYAGKTVEYCIPGDTICNGAPVGGPNALHVLYVVDGSTVNAANFVLSRL